MQPSLFRKAILSNLCFPSALQMLARGSHGLLVKQSVTSAMVEILLSWKGILFHCPLSSYHLLLCSLWSTCASPLRLCGDKVYLRRFNAPIFFFRVSGHMSKEFTQIKI